jgi:hypothetical protein
LQSQISHIVGGGSLACSGTLVFTVVRVAYGIDVGGVGVHEAVSADKKFDNETIEVYNKTKVLKEVTEDGVSWWTIGSVGGN